MDLMRDLLFQDDPTVAAAAQRDPGNDRPARIEVLDTPRIRVGIVA
jgi:hypothetical protein